MVVLISFTGVSQPKYEQEMQKAFDLWNADKPWEAVNLFERIATVETNNWLPPYYASLISVIHSFGEKNLAKLTAQLDKAMKFLNDAKSISNENPEILILDALWHTVWVAFDGAQYGMKYSAKVTQIYQDALKLAPNSPRVILNKAEWDMGGARFFGQPIEPYCKNVQRAIVLIANFKHEGKFYTTYGLKSAIQILEDNCKE